MKNSKRVATAVILAGGAFVGIELGWFMAPPEFELVLVRDQLALIGAGAGMLFCLLASYLASEYTDARAKNRQQLTTLRRLASLDAVPSKRKRQNTVAR
jgi:hypothetical protein